MAPTCPTNVGVMDGTIKSIEKGEHLSPHLAAGPEIAQVFVRRVREKTIKRTGAGALKRSERRERVSQCSTTTIMRGNRKGPNSNLKNVDLTEGVKNPMGLAWHASSCGHIAGMRRAAGYPNSGISLVIKRSVDGKAASVNVILDALRI
jgi:hypothetical protein